MLSRWKPLVHESWRMSQSESPTPAYIRFCAHDRDSRQRSHGLSINTIQVPVTGLSMLLLSY